MVDRNNITGIVLAGGESSRMGTDKGLMKLKQKPFVKHIIDAIQPLVNNVIIISNSTEYDQFGLRTYKDIIKRSGPLAGLHTGLYYSKTDYNLFVSCDVPLIKTKVLEQLINAIEEEYDVIQLKAGEKTMPLVAIYRKHCELPIEVMLADGERRVRVAVKQLKTKTINVDDDLSEALININTKEELNKVKHAIED